MLGVFPMSSPVLLALALVLLWSPLWMMRAKGTRLSGFDQRTWPRGRLLALAMVDVIRASVGVWALMQVLPDLPTILPVGAWQAPAFLALAIGVGLVVETLSWRDDDYVLAPVPFLLGAVSAAAHPIVLVIVLPLWIGGSLALRSWASGILALGLGLGGVGLAVSQQDWRRAALVGMASALPVLASIMAGRHMGWPKK